MELELKILQRGTYTDVIIADSQISETSEILIDGNTLIDSGSSDIHKVNTNKDFVQESANGGNNDTVSSLISYILGNYTENLTLENVVKTEIIDSKEYHVYGNPDDNRWILDYNQDNDGIVKVLDIQSSNPIKDFKYFGGDCGIVCVENILIQAGKVTNKEILYESTLPQFLGQSDRDLRQDVVLARAIQNETCEINSIVDTKLGGNWSAPINAGASIVSLLNSFGVASEGIPYIIGTGFLENIATKVKNGHGVILGIDSKVLWGNSQLAISANHYITVTGVAYNKETNVPEYFYICDSGRHELSRKISIQDLKKTIAYNSPAIITTDPIKNTNNDTYGTGNELDNTITGNDGNNVLTGNGGNDILKGGEGYDTYVFEKGDGQDVIIDSDKQGKVKINTNTLNKAYKVEDKTLSLTYWQDSYGNEYYKDGADLIIKYSKSDSVRIKDFNNNGLGIELLDEDNPDPPPPEDQIPGEFENKFNDAETSNFIRRDPLLVDLDGDGIETVGTSDGVYFDNDNNGFAELTGWVGKDDGILAVDVNDDGIINNGTELLGGEFVLDNGQRASTGFEALAQFDSNNDGKVDQNDAGFARIKVLKGNGNLISLDEAGIKSLNLKYGTTNKVDSSGNTLSRIGVFKRTDNTIGLMGDYIFATNPKYTIPVELMEVPSEIEQFPEVQASGNMYSLHQAMARDESGELQTLVGAFANETDLMQRFNLVDEIIIKWTEGENIDPDSRGNFNARKLNALERFVGRYFAGDENSRVVGNAPSFLNEAFYMLKEDVYAQLIAQTHLKNFFGKFSYSWDNDANDVRIDLTDVIPEIQNAIDADIGSGKDLLREFARTFKYLNLIDSSNYQEFYNSFAGQSPELKLILDNLDKNYISATVGDDTLNGTSLGDYIDGKDGNDHITGNDGNDAIIGASGNDTITGDFGDDLIIGNEGDDEIYGNNHRDTIYGGEGDDYIDAGCDNDYVEGGIGNDTILGGNYRDVIYGGEGHDSIQGNEFEDTIYGGEGNDTIDGGEGIDYLEGSSGDDELNGGAGHDIIIGGAGNDLLDGGEGIDFYVFNLGDGNDTIQAGVDADTIQLGAGINPEDVIVTQDGNNILLTIQGTTDSITILNPDGTYKTPILQFNDGTELVKGLDIDGTNRSETIVGSKGNDVIRALWGSDKVYGDSGIDIIYGEAGSDEIVGGQGGDILYGEDGDDIIYGGAGNDLIYGGSGKDRIRGGTGNDFLSGGLGYDDYYFSKGSGQDTIVDNKDIGSYTGTNKIHFSIYDYDKIYQNNTFESIKTNTGYIFSDDIEVTAEGRDLILSIKDTEDQLTILDFFNPDNYYSSSTFKFDFADNIFDFVSYYGFKPLEYLNESLNYEGTQNDDEIIGSLRHDSINGLDGNDSIYAYNGNDIIYAGKGNDYIEGGAGNDSYIFNLGDGQDTIFDSIINIHQNDSAGYDKIVFGENISANDLEFVTSGEDLIINISDNNDVITIKDYYASGNMIEKSYIIEEFVFSDGSNLTMHEFLEGSTLQGTSGDDEINGNSTSGNYNEKDELIIGGKGNDILRGNGGQDTYVYHRGDGQDTIYDLNPYGNAVQDEIDTLVFKDNITQDDVEFTTADNKDLIIKIKDSQGQITIDKFFRYSDRYKFSNIYKNYYIELFKFSDGTELTAKDIINSQIIEYHGNDLYNNIEGSPAAEKFYTYDGPDRIMAGNGDDYIDSGRGNDTISVKGGHNIINSAEGNDYIYGGIYNDDIYAGSGNDRIKPGNGNDYINAGPGDDYIEDYSSRNYDYSGNGNDTIEAGQGNDYIKYNDYFYSTYYGTKTVIFNPGDGQDVIQITPDLLDTLKFKFTEGINPDDLELTQENGNIQISIAGTSDKITIIKPSNAINEFDLSNLKHLEFTNGTIITNVANELIKPANDDEITVGSAENETYIAKNNDNIIIDDGGNDFYAAGGGNDYIFDLAGNDTYLFNRGDGQIHITDFSDNEGNLDKVIFGASITSDDIEFSRDVNNLVASIKGYTDKLIIDNWYKSDDYKIEIFEFADGTELSKDNVQTTINEINEGTDGDNAITGTAENDIFWAKKGNDTISDPSGNDTYIFKKGDGQDVIQDSDGVDTIKFGSGITSENLTFAKDGNNLAVSLNETNGITLQGWYANEQNRIETIMFADGTILGVNEIEELVETDPINITGAPGDDSLIGNDLDNNIYGLEGNDTLEGGIGADSLYGGTGDDLYKVDEIDAVFENINEGTDTVQAGFSYTLNDNVENLVLTGINNINGTGNELDNVITGNFGNNIIDGQAGADTMDGGFGDDLYIVDNVNAQVIEYIDRGNDTVQSSVNYVLFDNVENLELTGTDNINGTGNELNNEIIGNTGSNILEGNAGNDTYSAGSGNDTLTDSSGDDTYIFNPGDGQDNITDLEGDDQIQFGENISQDDLVFIKDENDLTIAFKDENKITEAANSIKIKDWYQGNKIESVNFNDGSSLTFAEIEAAVKELTSGTDKRNFITDCTGNSIIDAKAGNDRIFEFTGNDVIYAGSGRDYIHDYRGNDFIFGGEGNDKIYDYCGNDTISGNEGNDYIKDFSGNDIYLFNSGDGKDKLYDKNGEDKIVFGSDIFADEVAFFMDKKDLVISYAQDDQLTIDKQKTTKGFLWWKKTDYSIEQIELSDGSYLTASDINQVIQDMTAYADANSIALTSVEDVKNNAELMNIIANTWNAA